MIHLITMMVALAAGPPHGNHELADVERDGVRIESSLTAQVIAWRITNINREPITRFEVVEHHTYSPGLPQGWEFELKDGVFTAWASERAYGIGRGQSALITLRGGTGGSVLGSGPAKISVDGSQQTVEFDAVWASRPKPRTLWWLVAGVIAALATGHILWIRAQPLRR